MKPNKSIKHVMVIINPAAGQKQPILHTLNRIFTENEIDWDVTITKGKGDASSAAAQAAASNIDAVAVYGGDGTVMEVANALNGTQVPIAILPGGTANMLAAELDVPDDLEEAAQLIVDPSVRIQSVDMGNIDDHLFFHFSAGFLGDIANKTDREEKNNNGLLAYILSGLKGLQQLPDPILFSLTLDDETVEVEGIGCMVTNLGKIGIADLRLAQTIDLSDGIMDVMVIRDINLATFVKTLGSVIASGEISEAFWHRPVRKVSFLVPSQMPMMLDGEPFVSASETISAIIVPGAVSFLVPSA